MTKQDETLSHDKPCTLCATPRSVLVRCQIDETGKWHFVCPGKCWHSVSGGMEDARGHEKEHPHYRYGGMWKNKHADGALSAKKPKKVKQRQKEQRNTQTSSQATGDDREATDIESAGESTDASQEGGTAISA